MGFSERELEDLLVENPWLISPDLRPVKYLRGEHGALGRQIVLPSLVRRIDLLFKDNPGRPVIVELKRGELGREDVAQVLEYGGGLRLLAGEARDIFHREFDAFYAFPRLILVGQSASLPVRAAAAMAGVEIRLWGDDLDVRSKVGAAHVISQMCEYRALMDKGEFGGVSERYQLVDRIWNVLDLASVAALGEGLGRNGQSFKTGMVWPESVPFCEFVARCQGEIVAATFEFAPGLTDFRFNPDTWWLLFGSLFESPEAESEFVQFAGKHALGQVMWCRYGTGKSQPAFAFSKTLFCEGAESKLQAVFEQYLKAALAWKDRSPEVGG